MSEEILRYTDLAAAIQLAKANGMTTQEIVRELTRGMTYKEVRQFARKAAPLLDVSVASFLEMRRNE